MTMYKAVREALRGVVPDINLIDATTAACDAVTRWASSTVTRQEGACAAKGEPIPGLFAFPAAMRSCIYNHDHTGAHRDKHGETW